MMSDLDLPQDLIEEILCRVPVTSLRRLRSTCKRWYHEALFKDPRFIKKYFDKTEYHALMLIDYRVCTMSSVLDRVRRRVYMYLTSDGPSLTDPRCNEKVDLSEAFHCDGILLCSQYLMNRIVVWNPFSGQARWIQEQPHKSGVYALGYDKKELFRNYKILRLSCKYGTLGSWGALDKLGIYEFSSNTWRNLDAITPDQTYYFESDGGVSLNGNTYWVSTYNQKEGDNKYYSLLSFDFSTERFQRLCAPFDHEPCLIDTMALSVVREERLSLLYQSRKTRKVEIWMTDEIETNSVSWSKFLTVDLESLCFSSFMSFFIIDQEKKVVVCCDEQENSSFMMLWINKGGEDFRASPYISVDHVIEIWSFPCNCYPRLFGYVPKN